MLKKNKFRILGGILIMSIGLNITGCSDGKGGNDNENVNKKPAKLLVVFCKMLYNLSI